MLLCHELPDKCMRKYPNKMKRIGDYVLFLNKVLGTGAYSHVYWGFRMKDQAQVAIKVV